MSIDTNRIRYPKWAVSFWFNTALIFTFGLGIITGLVSAMMAAVPPAR
jgi:hypothetical protein